MPSLGMPEIFAILLVALIFLGPDKLPKAARQIGRAINELKRHSDNVKAELRDVVDLDEVTQMRRDFKDATSLSGVLASVDQVSAGGGNGEGPGSPAPAALNPLSSDTSPLDAFATPAAPLVSRRFAGAAGAGAGSRAAPATAVAPPEAAAGTAEQKPAGGDASPVTRRFPTSE